MSEADNIERFATLLDELGTGRHHQPDTEDPEMAALLRLSGELRRVPAPVARPQHREALLRELLARFDREGPGLLDEDHAGTASPCADPQPAGPGPRTSVAPRPRQGPDDLPVAAGLADAQTQAIRAVTPRRGQRARLAVVIGLASGALAISGVSLASTDSKPGDALYPVKGWGEQAQLLFAGSDANRGRLHLDFARIRLVEARQVEPHAVAGVLAELDRETTEGVRLLFTTAFTDGDASAIASVTAFVQQQRAELTLLQAEVAAAAAPAQTSLELLTAIEIRAHELQAALADGCTSASVDRFGPRPTC